jgi:predicted RNA-binding Zn-ribbon protein involved in translation (DUF1610 family)
MLHHRGAVRERRGGSQMIVQSACHASSSWIVASVNLSRPKCPRCGTVLLVAEESRFDISGRIDHAWSCYDCGNEFVTSISLKRR